MYCALSVLDIITNTDMGIQIRVRETVKQISMITLTPNSNSNKSEKKDENEDATDDVGARPARD
jgi:hypothetical protein